MADLKVTNALISDLLAQQKVAKVGKKSEGPPQADDKPADEAVLVDVDPRAEKLAEALPPPEQVQEKPAISEQAARQLALDVGQTLRGDNISFAGESEKEILSLFG